MIKRDPIILIFMFRVDVPRYDSPRTSLGVLEEDPNVGQEAAKTASLKEAIDAPSTKRRPVKRVSGSTLSHGILSSK